MSIDGLITVYRTDTGEKVRIPPHWMDNPDLSDPFERTPSSRARDAATPADTDTTADPGTVPDLDSTTTSTTTRATRPGRTTVQSDTETPAAGAKE